MCCSSRPSRAKQSGAGGGLASAVAVVFVVVVASAAASPPARAQVALIPMPARTPIPPPPTPSRTDIDSDMSAGAAVANLGSNFLERLGSQATYGFGSALPNNPDGGGASESTDAPRFRTWGEGYGISARNGAQADFVGDRRQTWGGVAGSGARLAPGG